MPFKNMRRERELMRTHSPKTVTTRGLVIRPTESVGISRVHLQVLVHKQRMSRIGTMPWLVFVFRLSMDLGMWFQRGLSSMPGGSRGFFDHLLEDTTVLQFCSPML